MNDVTCDVLVIGAGPGGYVCAIRAGQLGLDTVIADKGALGGTCLNVGCIPSKALIHAAEEFHRIVEASHGATPFGVACASPAIDFNATIAWKDGIVGRLNGGVAGLLKKAGVRRVEGAARFHDGRTVVVGSAEGETRIKASRIVIATGSVPSELPNLPFGG
ncbi:MAG: FAD-dependent oxidoreductase, partial [Pseudomonadota bacterium]